MIRGFIFNQPKLDFINFFGGKEKTNEVLKAIKLDFSRAIGISIFFDIIKNNEIKILVSEAWLIKMMCYGEVTGPSAPSNYREALDAIRHYSITKDFPSELNPIFKEIIIKK